MPDELDNLEDQQKTEETVDENAADESQELESEETVDDENQSDKDVESIDGDDDKGDDADADYEQERYDTEEDYLNKFNLPGQPKTLDDAMESYQAAVSELNRYQRETADDRRPAERDQRSPQQNAELGSSLFTGGHATSYIDSLIKQGTLTGDDNVKAAKFWASTQDKAIEPVLSDVKSVLGAMSGLMNQVIDDARNGSWARFKHKDLITKEQLEGQFGPDNMLDFEAAFNKLMLQDSDLFAKFTNRVEKRGEKRGQQRKLRRFSANPRSKPTPRTDRATYRNYLDKGGGLDAKKLDALPDAQKKKIVDAYLKEFDQK